MFFETVANVKLSFLLKLGFLDIYFY